MRILLAGQAFYQHNNGQAVFTINLAEGLAKAGHDILVLAPSERGRPYCDVQNGVLIQTVPTLPLQYNANITALSDRLVAQRMAAFAPDVVHIQDHYFLSRSVLRCADRYQAEGNRLKRIGTNHFLPDNLTDNVGLPAWLRPPVQHWLWQTMLTVYNRLDGVTTPTETAVAILKEVGLQVPVQAISCGVDSWYFRPRPNIDRAVMRRKYGLALDKNLLLFVGRVDHEKRLDVVIKALAHLKRDRDQRDLSGATVQNIDKSKNLTVAPDRSFSTHDQIQFVIAGKGSHQATLHLLAEELGVADQVVFTGFVPDADLPLLLNSVDAFIMPSHAELQSIATLEAMASGLPVLAANARALPELVTDGLNGYLFAPNDAEDTANAIAKLLNNREHWAAMCAASLERVKTHTADSTIQRYVDWYGQVQPAVQRKVIWRPVWQWIN